MTNEQNEQPREGEEGPPNQSLPPGVVVPDPHPGPTPDRRAYDLARDDQVRKYNEEQAAINEATMKRAAAATAAEMEAQAQQQSQQPTPQTVGGSEAYPNDAPGPEPEPDEVEPENEGGHRRGSKHRGR
jgi:hypothetical protein